jgi:hypothetical protein
MLTFEVPVRFIVQADTPEDAWKLVAQATMNVPLQFIVEEPVDITDDDDE